MSFTTVLHRLPVLAFALAAPLDGQTPTHGSGLEVTNYETVDLLIDPLNDHASRIGLTEARLRTRIELRLRQARLTPGGRGADEYLYVVVHVVGGAFHVSVEFIRPVTYFVGSKPRSLVATVWGKATTGTHGSDPEYIVQAVDGQMDRFLNEYLAANQPTR